MSTAPLPYLNAAIQALPKGGAPQTMADLARLPGGKDLHMLHLNECPYPPSPKVIEAIVAAAGSVNRYPESVGVDLANDLAERTGVPAARIVFGTGSDELLHLACMVTLEAGRSAVFPAPSFPRYRVSTALLGARAIRAGLTPDGANDVDALVAAVAPDTRIVFSCNPNNPSGAQYGAEDLERLIAGVPDDVLLVLDEAYHEFGIAAGGVESLPIIAKRRGPWIVMRTFSKAYALAGIRVGYALCSEEAISDALRKAKYTFNVTNLAYLAARAALRDETHLNMILDSCATQRARLVAGLEAIGLKPMPSVTNFVSVDLARPVAPVIAAMQEHGVLVRDWREVGYENHLRIGVGLPKETDAALDGMAAIWRRNAAE